MKRVAINDKANYERGMAEANRSRIPTDFKGGASQGSKRRNAKITLPSFITSKPEPKKPAQAKQDAAIFPPDQWQPAETMPRDGRWIIVKRKPAPNLKHPEIKVRWYQGYGGLSYWSTETHYGVREDNIISWKPA